MPVDPAFSVTGPEWSVGAVAPAQPATGATGAESGFAKVLGSLQASQDDAAKAVQGMVTGETTDPTAAVMALERARLSMQLAGQIRTKAVEAFQDVFHTQI
jgi:flagellar hook-basal body complex protein FliE